MDLYEVSSGVLFFLLFTGLGYAFLRVTWTQGETLAFQSRLFLWAMAIRFAVSLVIYEGGLINTFKDEDSGGWHRGADYAKAWTSQGHSALEAPLLFFQAYSTSNRGYYYLLGVLFMTTGLPGRMPAAALNCMVGALTIVFTYRVARCLFAERVARLAATFACFFPSLIIWSAQTLKEPVVIFLETLALYGCISLRTSGFTFRHIALVSLAAILLYPFRFYAAYLVVGTILITLLLPRFGKGKTSFTAAFAVAGTALAFILLSGAQVTKELEQQRFDLEYVEMLREGGTIGQGSGVKIDADLHTTTGFSFALSVGALHLLLAPFPWQWGGSLRMALVIPEVIVWWGLVVYGVLPGLWHCLRNRLQDVLPLLLFLVGMGLLYSLLFSNIGLVYRQRAQLLPWLLIFAAVGIERRRAQNRSGSEAAQGADSPFSRPRMSTAATRSRPVV